MSGEALTSVTPREIALAFLDSWAAGDIETVRKYLDPDIDFESPQASLSGIEAVAAAMGEFAQVVSSISVLAATANDEGDVIVMYDMQTQPFGTIRAAEYYRVRDGRIVSDRLVFDTAAIASSAEQGQSQH